MSGVDLGVEEPWELPEGWAWTTVDAVAPVNPSTSFEGLDDEAEVVFVPMAAVSEETGDIDLSVRRRVDEVAKGFVKFRSGDVIFAKITPCMENGKIAPVPAVELPFAGSTEFQVLRPSAAIAQRYLWYFLVQRSFRARAQRNMGGSAGQMRVPTSFLREAAIPLPPLAEQRRIVARIDALFAEIAEGEAALARARAGLETFRRALLKAAVTGELTREWREGNATGEAESNFLTRASDTRVTRFIGKSSKRTVHAPRSGWPSVPRDLPKGWVCATVRDLSEFVTSGSRGWKEYYSDSGAIFIRAQNINTGVIDLSDVAYVELPPHAEGLRTRLKLGDVLITITGANVTVSARVDSEIPEAYVSQHVALVRPLLVEISEFLLLCLQADGSGKTQLTRAAYGAGKPGLNLDNIREIEVLLPPPSEAAEILRRVSDALSAHADTLALLDAEAADAARLRQAVLKAAFEGRLVAQDPTDEPARAMLDRLAKSAPSTEKRGRARPRAHR